MTEEQSAPVSDANANPKDLSQVVQGTAENLLNKLEENLGEQKGNCQNGKKVKKVQNRRNLVFIQICMRGLFSSSIT